MQSFPLARSGLLRPLELASIPLLSIPLLWNSLLSISLLALGTLACSPYPRDPEHTTESVLERRTLRVGVAEAPPWVIRRGEEPDGVEIRLIQSFADHLGVTPRWIWGSVEDHAASLETFELDLLAAGLTRSSPWRRRLGTTRPYYEERMTVGGLPPGAGLEGREIAVREGSALVARLEERGARPLPVADLWASPGPKAAAAWELAGHPASEAEPSAELTLSRHAHVLAVPPGENRWLLALEEHLSGPEAPEVPGLLGQVLRQRSEERAP